MELQQDLNSTTVLDNEHNNSTSTPLQRGVLIVFAIFTAGYAVYSIILLYCIRHITPCPPQARVIGHVVVSELLYILLALITTLLSTLGPAQLPGTWCHVFVTLKSWTAVVSMLAQASKALESYWFICHPLHYDESLVGKVGGFLTPCVWVGGLVFSIGTMICFPDKQRQVFRYTMVLCEHPSIVQAYIGQLILFLFSTSVILFSSANVLCTTYKHINMDKEVRKIRVHLTRPTNDNTSAVMGTLPIDSIDIDALPGPSGERHYIGLDERTIFAIPETNEDLDFISSEKIPRQEVVKRPSGPTRMLRNSVISRSRISSTNSVETLNHMDVNEDLRRISTTAKYGSQRDIGQAVPVELYFRISTCTTVDQDEVHKQQDDISREEESELVPRIEIISPTTAGCRSQQSTTVSDYSMPSDDQQTPTKTNSCIPSKDDDHNDTPEAWKNPTEDHTENAVIEGNIEDTQVEPLMNNASELLDFKISYSVCDMNGSMKERSISMDAGLSCKLSSQEIDEVTKRPQHLVRFNSQKAPKSKCSVTAKVEFSTSPPGSIKRRSTAEITDSFKIVKENTNSSLILDENTPIVAVLNRENLSKFNRSFKSAETSFKRKNSGKLTRNDSGRNNSSTFSRTNSKKSQSPAGGWTIEYSNSMNDNSHDAKLSITRQLTIKDLLAEDCSSSFTPTTPMGDHRSSDIARHRKFTSFCKVVTKLFFYLIQWLPLGIYIIWGALQSNVDTRSSLHFALQIGCQLSVMVGSIIGLVFSVKSCEELRIATKALMQYHNPTVHPGIERDERGGHGLPM